jgi:4-aminobutyrate aminotransferase-like enzyme
MCLICPLSSSRTSPFSALPYQSCAPRRFRHADLASYAENALWDRGNRFIDFVGGIAVLNTGHRHQVAAVAAKAQEDLYTHTSFRSCSMNPMLRWPNVERAGPGDHPQDAVIANWR